jgi:DNA-nicking Smr family endonuclease
MAKSFEAKRSEADRANAHQHVASRHDSALDRMAYMADLLLELKGMATSDGNATLAGLLALAHMEALSKSR